MTRKNEQIAEIHQSSNLLFAPECKAVSIEEAEKIAARCTDYNDSCSEKRNFKFLEIKGATFNREDFSSIEAHYSKFVDCEFNECKLSRMEAYFATFENCTFKNCDLENANFSFCITDTVFFYNCNLNSADFPFARGHFVCSGCMLERSTANHSNLKLELSNTNAIGFEANCSKLEIRANDSCLKRSEFNDGEICGEIRSSDLSDAEFNRSKLSDLYFAEGNAICGLETEDSEGFEGFEISLEEEFDDED